MRILDCVIGGQTVDFLILKAQGDWRYRRAYNSVPEMVGWSFGSLIYLCMHVRTRKGYFLAWRREDGWDFSHDSRQPDVAFRVLLHVILYQSTANLRARLQAQEIRKSQNIFILTMQESGL